MEDLLCTDTSTLKTTNFQDMLTVTIDRVLSMFSLTGGISIPSEFEGLPKVRTSVVDRQTLAVLYSNAKGQWTHSDERRHLVPDPSGKARIVLFQQDGKSVTLPPFFAQSSWIQFAVRPHGGWVAGRTRQHIASDVKADFAVYNSAGVIEAVFESGGNVGFLEISDNDLIWVGHEDEDPDHPEKLGGLSLFSPSGDEHIYSWFEGFEGSAEFGMAFWCCYALNVVGDTAWTQFYTDMLISRTEPDGSQQHWRCYPKGAAALIVQGDLIALAGRYGETQYDIMAYRLGEPPHAERIGQVRFSIKGDQPKYLDSITGKGDAFHIVHDNKWYRITLDDILARLPSPQ
jgi:hypothetical protein